MTRILFPLVAVLVILSAAAAGAQTPGPQATITSVNKADVKVFDATGRSLGTRTGADLVGRPVVSVSTVFPMVEVATQAGRVFVNRSSVTTNRVVPAAQAGCTVIGTQDARTRSPSTNGLSSSC